MTRYLAARAGSGASVATLRLPTSAIAKAHEWAKQESPCRDPGVRALLKRWGRRLSKPQRQAGALTADVLAVIRLTSVQPRLRGRGVKGGGKVGHVGGSIVSLRLSQWYVLPPPLTDFTNVLLTVADPAST